MVVELKDAEGSPLVEIDLEILSRMRMHIKL